MYNIANVNYSKFSIKESHFDLGINNKIICIFTLARHIMSSVHIKGR